MADTKLTALTELAVAPDSGDLLYIVDDPGGTPLSKKITVGNVLDVGTTTQAHGDVLDDLNTLGANSADGEFLVGTAAGALAWESGATARTSMGVGTGDTPQFTGIEVGHATDTTITRVGAGEIGVEGTQLAKLDGALQDIDTLGPNSADGEIMVGTGPGALAWESGATARTSLGAQAQGDVLDDLNTLGASTADGEFLVATGIGALAWESGATARTSLGVDAAGTDNSTNVTLAAGLDYLTIAGQEITLGSIDLTTDVTGDLPVAEGGTGASDAATARTNLGAGTVDPDSTDTFTNKTFDANGTGNTLSNVESADCNSANSIVSAVVAFVIDGGGSAITTGIKGDIEIPFSCTIDQVTMLADQSGSIVVDIWKDTYANFPPTDVDSITASAVPTISTATKSQDATLTGWTTSVTAGDILRYNVDSASTVTRVTVSLQVTKT